MRNRAQVKVQRGAVSARAGAQALRFAAPYNPRLRFELLMMVWRTIKRLGAGRRHWSLTEGSPARDNCLGGASTWIAERRHTRSAASAISRKAAAAAGFPARYNVAASMCRRQIILAPSPANMFRASRSANRFVV